MGFGVRWKIHEIAAQFGYMGKGKILTSFRTMGIVALEGPRGKENSKCLNGGLQRILQLTYPIPSGIDEVPSGEKPTDVRWEFKFPFPSLCHAWYSTPWENPFFQKISHAPVNAMDC